MGNFKMDFLNLVQKSSFSFVKILSHDDEGGHMNISSYFLLVSYIDFRVAMTTV